MTSSQLRRRGCQERLSPWLFDWARNRGHWANCTAPWRLRTRTLIGPHSHNYRMTLYSPAGKYKGKNSFVCYLLHFHPNSRKEKSSREYATHRETKSKEQEKQCKFLVLTDTHSFPLLLSNTYNAEYNTPEIENIWLKCQYANAVCLCTYLIDALLKIPQNMMGNFNKLII